MSTFLLRQNTIEVFALEAYSLRNVNFRKQLASDEFLSYIHRGKNAAVYILLAILHLATVQPTACFL